MNDNVSSNEQESSEKIAFEILRNFDDKCPTHHGRHDWVGTRAYQLIKHDGLNEDAAYEQLIKETSHVPAERNIERDINEAIRTAVLKRDGIDLPRRRVVGHVRTSTLPDPDQEMIREITAKYHKFNFERWAKETPTVPMTAAAALSMLFKPGMLVCCGRVANDPGEIWPVEAWVRNPEVLSSKALFVPNPMIHRFVCDENGLLKRTPTGKPSVRRQENVAERRYLITEFDEATFDDSARLVYYLGREHIPLVWVVDTCGKSPHYGWNCVGQPAYKIEAFFNLACKLGACISQNNLHQYCRLPGGWRDEWKGGKRIVGHQEIVYFDPSRLPE